MLSPGTLVGRYRVVEHVGAEETMAEVYRALDEETGRTVAVKLLGPSTGLARREAAAVAGLSYPGIVRTYEIFEHDGRLCLVQEWVEGKTLAAVLDSVGSLNFAATLRLGRDVASALSYAHNHGILHRDIKPSNVLITVDGQYKLVDFGVAGLLEPTTGRTASGQIAGTPLYMSPEQAFGTSQTAASDVFGLGLLLYRCLYGTLPGEAAANYLELAKTRATTAITVPPSPLKRLIERCLAIDPRQRPQSAGEVLDELYQFLTVPLAAPDPFDWYRSAPVEGAREVPRPPASTRPALKIRMALAAVIVVAIGLLLSLLIKPSAFDAGLWLRIGVGVLAVSIGFLVARWIRRLASRAPEAEREAASILTGAGQRKDLTRSMIIEVDQVVAKLKSLDARFLGLTMVALIREAEAATESADRVAALGQLVTLMEKVTKQLSPWHIRHKEAIATGIAVVGSLVGVASVVSGFLR